MICRDERRINRIWSDGRSRRLLERLRKADVNFHSELYRPRAKAGPLAGKTFVLTGTLPNLKREEATAKIEAAGGSVVEVAWDAERRSRSRGPNPAMRNRREQGTGDRG